MGADEGGEVEHVLQDGDFELRWTWDDRNVENSPSHVENSPRDPECPVVFVTLVPPAPRAPVGPFSCLVADPFYRLALAARLERVDREAGLHLLEDLAHTLDPKALEERLAIQAEDAA